MIKRPTLILTVLVTLVVVTAVSFVAMAGGVSAQGADETPTPVTTEATPLIDATETATPTPTMPTIEAAPTAGPQIVVELPAPGTSITGDRVFWLVIASVAAAWSVLVGVLLLFKMAIRELRDADGIEKLGRPALEGITLVMVVVAVIILGIQDRIGDQGIVGILSAIVGFLLGRTAGRPPQAGPGGQGGGGGGN